MTHHRAKPLNFYDFKLLVLAGLASGVFRLVLSSIEKLKGRYFTNPNLLGDFGLVWICLIVIVCIYLHSFSKKVCP